MLQYESQAYNYYPRGPRAAAEMAEQQVNPKLTHRIASGNVDAAATEKKIEALELLHLTQSTVVADVCRLSKLEYFS